MVRISMKALISEFSLREDVRKARNTYHLNKLTLFIFDLTEQISYILRATLGV